MYDLTTILSKKRMAIVLQFTDRDSLCYDISTKDVYMKEHQIHFDFRDYLQAHFIQSNLNK